MDIYISIDIYQITEIILERLTVIQYLKIMFVKHLSDKVCCVDK